MQEARFEMDTDDLEVASRYLHNRAIQILMDGFRPLSLQPLEADGVTWGMRALCQDPDGRIWQSVYVRSSQRRCGHMKRYLSAWPLPVVTTPDCRLEEYLAASGCEYRVAARFTETHEYQTVQTFYGDRRAQRSGLFYMNHIDEGLAVLAQIGASDRARRAFCLHPLLQLDDDLAQTYSRVAELTQDPQVLTLAMEYRSIANAYRSHMAPRDVDDIQLGPLSEVHDMLRADKIQNFKDFLLFHHRRHPRTRELERYFRGWLARLRISDDDFAQLFETLQCHPAPRRLSDVLSETQVAVSPPTAMMHG